MVHISVSDVQLFATRFNQRCITLVGHHTNDLSPLSLRRENAKQDPFADSRLVWKCFCCECLINYEQFPIRRAVVLRESPSGKSLVPMASK